jgi:arylsulfatase A-like enzyme
MIRALGLSAVREPRSCAHLENFYCASPVCSAARASILTGRIPSNHGVLDWLRSGAMKGVVVY